MPQLRLLQQRSVNPLTAYWIAKIDRTMKQDLANQRWLEENGWQVLRFWETEILSNPHSIVAEVLEALSHPEL